MILDTDALIAQADRFLEEYVYGFIYHDVRAAIQGNASYLAALGLVAYTEFMGGLRTGKLGKAGSSRARFYAFFDTLGPAYADVRRRRAVTKVYSNIRCGLAHAYFINQESVVKMSEDYHHGGHCGIEVGQDGVVYFVVRRYWQDFQAAVDAYREALVTDRDPDLVSRFREAVGSQWHFEKLRH